MIKYNNLHSHTINSDGSITVQEAIKFCEDNEVGAVAFTDHDSVLTKSDIQYLENYKGDVRWVSGIEISVGNIPELQEKVPLLHMVGLFVDPTNPQLKKFCKRAQAARKERMQRIVKNLKSIDIHITEQDCLEASGGEAVGRPHIVEAIMKYERNIQKINELYNKMKEESTQNHIAKEKVKEIEDGGDGQKPYTIFLSRDAYIPNIYVDYTFRPSWDECVSTIRNAGGLSFLAHYSYSSHKLPLSLIEKLLKEDRLDGVEVVYGLGEQGVKNDRSHMIEEHQHELMNIAKRTECYISGGSDAHSFMDWESFLKNKEFASRTTGLLEGILEKSDRKLEWYKSQSPIYLSNPFLF